jgi:lysozyme
VNELVTVRPAQHECDMPVSFTFNLGTGALAGVTLLRKRNQGDYASVPDETARWLLAGVKRPGLVRRRAAGGWRFRHRLSMRKV